MPPCLGPQQLLQKGTLSPNRRSEHGAAARSLPSWKAERLARRCRYSPVAGSGAIAALAGRGLRRRAGCPTAGQAVQTPWPRSPSQDWGPRAEAQLPRRSRRSPEREACAAVQPLGGRRAGDPSVHLAPGSLLALHFFFFSPSSSEGFFILKCNFLPSLLFPTRIQTATVEKGMYVFAPDWAGGAPRRRRGPGPPPRSPGVSATARWTLSVAPSARQPWHSLDRNSSLCGTSKKFRWLLPYEGEGVEGGGICLLYLIFFFFFFLA